MMRLLYENMRYPAIEPSYKLQGVEADRLRIVPVKLIQRFGIDFAIALEKALNSENRTVVDEDYCDFRVNRLYRSEAAEKSQTAGR